MASRCVENTPIVALAFAPQRPLTIFRDNVHLFARFFPLTVKLLVVVPG